MKSTEFSGKKSDRHTFFSVKPENFLCKKIANQFSFIIEKRTILLSFVDPVLVAKRRILLSPVDPVLVAPNLYIISLESQGKNKVLD